MAIMWANYPGDHYGTDENGIPVVRVEGGVVSKVVFARMLRCLSNVFKRAPTDRAQLAFFISREEFAYYRDAIFYARPRDADALVTALGVELVPVDAPQMLVLTRRANWPWLTCKACVVRGVWPGPLAGLDEDDGPSCATFLDQKG